MCTEDEGLRIITSNLGLKERLVIFRHQIKVTPNYPACDGAQTLSLVPPPEISRDWKLVIAASMLEQMRRLLNNLSL